jgi:hypothetical protein
MPVIGFIAAALATTVAGWVMVWQLWRGAAAWARRPPPTPACAPAAAHPGWQRLADGRVLWRGPGRSWTGAGTPGLRYLALAGAGRRRDRRLFRRGRARRWARSRLRPAARCPAPSALTQRAHRAHPAPSRPGLTTKDSPNPAAKPAISATQSRCRRRTAARTASWIASKQPISVKAAPAARPHRPKPHPQQEGEGPDQPVDRRIPADQRRRTPTGPAYRPAPPPPPRRRTPPAPPRAEHLAHHLAQRQQEHHHEQRMGEAAMHEGIGHEPGHLLGGQRPVAIIQSSTSGEKASRCSAPAASPPPAARRQPARPAAPPPSRRSAAPAARPRAAAGSRAVGGGALWSVGSRRAPHGRLR